MRIGDDIKADMGGGMWANGIIHSVTETKVRVRLPGGQIVEAERSKGHTVNGIKPTAPRGAHALLAALDQCKNLSEWEAEFVGDLVDSRRRQFTTKQEEMIERVYKRRVQDNV